MCGGGRRRGQHALMKQAEPTATPDNTSRRSEMVQYSALVSPQKTRTKDFALLRAENN